jgi:hypothetical protein
VHYLNWALSGASSDDLFFELTLEGWGVMRKTMNAIHDAVAGGMLPVASGPDADCGSGAVGRIRGPFSD